MKRGGDLFERRRREWLKRALLGGVAMLLLLRHALAAGGRADAIVEVEGEVQVNGRRVRAGDAVMPGDSVVTAAASHAVFVLGRKPPFVGPGGAYSSG